MRIIPSCLKVRNNSPSRLHDMRPVLAGAEAAPFQLECRLPIPNLRTFLRVADDPFEGGPSSRGCDSSTRKISKWCAGIGPTNRVDGLGVGRYAARDRQRKRRVLATGAPAAAEQVNHKNQCFAV
jgi:hypothetical protein